MSPRIASCLFFAAATLAGSAALAQTSNAARSPWSVGAEVGPAWHHDGSYLPFVRNSAATPVAGLFVGRDLAHLGPRLTLGAELGWRTANAQGNVRQAFATTLTTHGVQAALTLRVELLSWLTPYARVAGGASYLDASVEDGDGGTLSGGAWAPYGSAGGGVMLTSGRWFDGIGAHTLRVAVSVEGGYQYVAPTAIAVSQPAPADERAASDRVASQSTALGTLDPSAAYLRVTVGLRF
jgi:hypothetical protein